MKKTPAAEAFTALGIDPADYTPAMALAVKQKWSDLPTGEKVDVLRTRLAAVTTVPVQSLAELEDAFAAAGDTDPAAAAAAEHARLKRNASVNAWRARNQLQAALDARTLKFAALQAKRGKTAAPRAGTETGAPLANAS